MKKQLMATTALVTAGVLAGSGAAFAQAKPTLTIGGWFEGIVGFVDDDDNGPGGRHVSVDVQQDSEIHFKGAVKLDNGIRLRTRVELEAQSANSTDQIDEAYIDVSGTFGAIRIGSEDNAAHLMVTPFQGSWATNVGQNLHFDVSDWIEAPSGHHGNIDRLDLGDADSEKVTYFTPRIAGFQLGATYMPSFSEGDNGEPEATSENPHEGWAVAANYRGKFGAVGIGAGVGYATIHPSAGRDQSDLEGLAAGIALDFANFTVSYGYNKEMNLSAETAAADNGVEAHDVGVRYKMGKNNFSVGYKHSENEASRAVAADDETDIAMASYRYDLGPGVQYRLNVMYADYEGENTGSADDNEGVAVTTSVRIAF